MEQNLGNTILFKSSTRPVPAYKIKIYDVYKMLIASFTIGVTVVLKCHVSWKELFWSNEVILVKLSYFGWVQLR